MNNCFEVRSSARADLADTFYVIAHSLEHVWNYCAVNGIKSVRQIPCNQVRFLSTDYSKVLYLYKACLRNKFGPVLESLILIALRDSEVLNYIKENYAKDSWTLTYLELQPNFLCLDREGNRFDLPRE